MRELYVLSGDAVLARYLELILTRAGACVRVIRDAEDLPAHSFAVVDGDTSELPTLPGDSMLCLSYSADLLRSCPCLRLQRPFRPARLLAVLGLAEEKGASSILPLPESCSLLCEGERVQLTETEYSLFEALWEAGGAFVSKETLHQKIWSGQGDAGIVNVYIHYLRRKLEKRGQRYILSSRGRGYALKGGDLC